MLVLTRKVGQSVMIDDNRFVQFLCCLRGYIQNATDPSMCAGTKTLITGNEGTVEDRDFVSQQITKVVHRLDSSVCGLHHMEDVFIR